MPAVRNPLTGLALTILSALGLSFLVGLPILFLPAPEIALLYLPFALFGIGLFAGRSSYIGFMGFAGATLGAFAGTYVFRILFLPAGWPMWPLGWEILLDVGFALACGLGGLATGKLGLRRLERLTANTPKVRRCRKCGAKVGLTARKCWDCKAYLPPT
ncbi:MAG TPA: hypothetical protein VIL45_01760 [Thermoplasmata archaeon]